MSAEAQFDRAPQAAAEPANASGCAPAQAPQQEGPVVLLQRVQRSHGNRYVQRLVADYNRSQQRAIFRSCSCGTCERCQQQAANEEQLSEMQEQPALVQAQARGEEVATSATDAELIPADSVSQPLDGKTRDFMESRFGRELGDVRIHDDAKAAQAAESLGAEAFTTGRDIYFAAGRYAPETPAGQHLLAHELAHTIQQSEGATPTSIAARAQGTVVGAADDPLEHEAERAADRVTAPAAGFAGGHPASGGGTTSEVGSVASSASGTASEHEAVPSPARGGGSGWGPPALSRDSSGAARAFSFSDTAVGRAASYVGGRAVGAAQYVGGKVTGAAEYVGEQVGAAAEAGKEFLIEQIERLAPGVIPFLRNVKGFVTEKIGAGFDGLFGGLAGRLRRDGLAGTIEGLVGELAGGALKSAGKFIAGACSALGEGASFLIDLAKTLGGQALTRFKEDAAALGAFFSDLWTRYGAPGLAALKSFASSVWNDVTRKLKEVWAKLEPIRRAVAKAWDFVVGSYLEGKRTVDGWLDDLFQWAAEKWEAIKTDIKPYMGYVKALGVILLLLSPMGPVVASIATVYGLYQGIKYVWDNWGKSRAQKALNYLTQEVLPGILNAVDALKAKIEAARIWLSGLADSLAALGAAALEAIGANRLFALARGLARDLSAQFQKFAAKVRTKLAELATRVGEFLDGVRRYIAPFLELYRQVLLVALTGPFAILDDGVWASINRIVRFALTVPCVRELAQIAQVPALLAQAERFRTLMKGVWKVITNPDPIVQALHDALEPMVAQVPAAAAAIVAGLIYPDEQTHREGVERHLLKAIEKLQSDWWSELKRLGWNLLWPWDEVKEKVPAIIKHGSDAIDALLNLEISLAIDKFLKMMQEVNAVLGALWGWFALAAVLIGAVLGALGVEFSAGASIGAGAAAGWALAEQVGIGLLAVAAATELAIVGKAMFDLRFTNTTQKSEEARLQANEEDYENIAGSTFSMAIMGAMLILGALAQKLGAAIWSKVKGIVPESVRGGLNDFLGKPRGRAGEGTRTGEPVDAGPPREKPADPDTTAGPRDFTPEEIRAAETKLREKLQDPDNVRDLTDTNGKYDAEIDLGDGRKMQRNRETGLWCLSRNPKKCGLDLGADVNDATSRGKGRGRKPRADVGTDITDQVKAGKRSKPPGEEWRHTNNWEKWVENGGTIKEHADGSITLTTQDGVSCKYDPGGNPDYSPFLDHPTGVKQVTIDEFTTRPADFKKANQAAGHPEWGDLSPDGYTWHHMPDLKTLQLAPRWVHRLFRHAGGFSKRAK